ncbi:hypothetical protein [Brevundimonas diminuta]|uniref:hypothetical protein n=1 Tax=Brevundimonas diminuta TaxID=293 RepID=UPI00320B8E79
MRETEFWALTPYQLSLRLDAAMEASLFGGWWAERFAREERLQSPQHYVDTMLKPADPALAEAQALAKFHRMAEDWGLQVEGGEE